MKFIRALDALSKVTDEKKEEWGKRFDDSFEELTTAEPTTIWGAYVLKVRRIEKEKGFDNSHALLYRDGEPLLEVQHNYPQFPHLFIEQEHTTYLLVPYHYEHMALVNLKTLDIKYYQEDHWCFAGVILEPNERGIFALSGCYWAAPYDIRIYQVEDGELKLLHDCEPPSGEILREGGYCPHWSDDGKSIVFPYMADKGRDGKTDEEEPWKSCEMWWEDGRLLAKDLPNKYFTDDGNHFTKEALENFAFKAVLDVDTGKYRST